MNKVLNKTQLEKYLLGVPPEFIDMITEAASLDSKYFEAESGQEVYLNITRHGKFKEARVVHGFNSLKGMIISARNSVVANGTGGKLWLSTSVGIWHERDLDAEVDIF
jgi:hypothetical protein